MRTRSDDSEILSFLLPVSLACLVGFGALNTGCVSTTETRPNVARFRCHVRAVAPTVAEVLDAEQLIRDLYTGRANLSAVADALDLTRTEVNALRERLRACSAPQVDAGVDGGEAS